MSNYYLTSGYLLANGGAASLITKLYNSLISLSDISRSNKTYNASSISSNSSYALTARQLAKFRYKMKEGLFGINYNEPGETETGNKIVVATTDLWKEFLRNIIYEECYQVTLSPVYNVENNTSTLANSLKIHLKPDYKNTTASYYQINGEDYRVFKNTHYAITINSFLSGNLDDYQCIFSDNIITSLSRYCYAHSNVSLTGIAAYKFNEITYTTDISGYVEILLRDLDYDTSDIYFINLNEETAVFPTISYQGTINGYYKIRITLPTLTNYNNKFDTSNVYTLRIDTASPIALATENSGSVYTCAGADKVKAVTINSHNSGYKILRRYAFCGCTNLTRVILGPSNGEIDLYTKGVFGNCALLKELYICCPITLAGNELCNPVTNSNYGPVVSAPCASILNVYLLNDYEECDNVTYSCFNRGSGTTNIHLSYNNAALHEKFTGTGVSTSFYWSTTLTSGLYSVQGLNYTCELGYINLSGTPTVLTTIPLSYTTDTVIEIPGNSLLVANGPITYHESGITYSISFYNASYSGWNIPASGLTYGSSFTITAPSANAWEGINYNLVGSGLPAILVTTRSYTIPSITRNYTILNITYPTLYYSLTLSGTGGSFTVLQSLTQNGTYSNVSISNGVYNIKRTWYAKITPTANTGYTWNKWQDNNSTTAIRTIQVASDTSLTALFTINQYTITVAANTGGSVSIVSPSGSGNTRTVNHGTSVKIKATQSTGYTFSGWKVGTSIVSTSNPYTFTATSTATYTAQFTASTYTLTYDTNPSGLVPITVALAATGNVYNYGTNVTLNMASMPTGYTFVGWIVNGANQGTSSSITVVMNSNKSVIAQFTTGGNTDPVIVVPRCSLEDGTEGDKFGEIIIDGTEFYDGDKIKISVKAFDDYKFLYWEIDCGKCECDPCATIDDIYAEETTLIILCSGCEIILRAVFG